CDLARGDVDALAQTAEADRLGRLVERVEELVRRLVSARQQVPARPVGAHQVRAARELQHRIDVLTAQHEAASARLRIESLGAAVEVSRPGTTADEAEVLTAG